MTPHDDRRRCRGTKNALLGLLAAAALMMTACSSAGTAESSPGSGNGEVSADRQARLDKAYEGTFEPPPDSGPTAVKGKSVWWISCGEAYVACQIPSRGIKAAATHLNWDVEVKDGAASADTMSDIIRSAIGAGVDAVLIDAMDCPNIKGALEAAKAAGLPVGAIISADCDDPSFGSGGDSLFAFTPKLMGYDSPLDYWAAWSKARAEYVAAKVGDDAEVVLLGEKSYANQILQNESFEKHVTENCTGCSVKTVSWTFAQIPSPATQIWQTAIASNPNAKAIAFSGDSTLSLGLLTAIKSSGRSGDQGLVIGGGEGSPDNIALIREGKYQTFSTAMSYDWMAWAAADDLNRLFSGEDPATFPNQGGGWQIVDTEHNLPKGTDEWTPPIDYKAAYVSMWTAS